MTEPERKSREFTVSRRMFIAGALVGGTAAIVGGAMLVPREQLNSLMRSLHQPPLAVRIPTEAKRNDRSIFRTAFETLIVFASNVGLGHLSDFLGIDHGGHAADGELYEEQVEAKPVSMYVQHNIAMPIFEESMFRLLPSAMVSSPGMHWRLGLASTALFASIHNFSKPAHDKITVHLDSLPVEQFVLGAYCWYAQRSGGFLHSAGSHVLYNNLCEAYWQLFEKKQYEEMLAKEKAEQEKASGKAEQQGDAS